MQGIEVTLKRNKQYTAENSEEYEVISGENNATTVLVHFPEEYKNFSKRVDFKNVRNEKWTIPLYTPEDETKTYGEDFDKLNFAFTLPTAVTINGELSIQFIAYLADATETFVPFKLFKVRVEDSIMYVKKQGSENPDLVLRAYEYSNMALETSREAFDKIEHSEELVKLAQTSASVSQTNSTIAKASAQSAKASATKAETSAKNAEISAKNAENSANTAVQVSNDANEKSDNAVQVSNNANTKSDNAVATSNTANTTSENALKVANEANEKSNNAVSVSNTANTKSDNAVNVSNDANNKADSAVKTSNNALATSQNALSVANTSNTKADNAVSTSNSANTKSETAIETANSAKQTAEEALNQVVEKMGTKVFIGDNEMPESDLNFTSNPQNQLDTNKTLAESNKTRLDNHDTQLSNHSTKLTTHDSEISSTKTRLTNLENQPVITKILYDEDGNAFEFKGKWKSDSLELQGGFTALKKIGGGFMISDEVNVGMELGRKDGTAGTPYLDFHTDGSSSTDFNSRLIAKGNGLYVQASDGLFLNGWKSLALRNKTSVSTTITMTGGTTTRTYDRTIGIIDLNSCAIVTFSGLIDPAYASNQGSWYTFVVNIPASALSSLKSRGFSTAFSLSYSLLQADGSPMNDYTNSQVQSKGDVTYSDSGGINIKFAFKRYYSENTANHDLNISILIV